MKTTRYVIHILPYTLTHPIQKKREKMESMETHREGNSEREKITATLQTYIYIQHITIITKC